MPTESPTVTLPAKRKTSRTGVVLLFIFIIILASFGAYSFSAWRKAVADNPLTAQHNVIQTVNRLAVTPNETPQVATVKDASKLTAGALASVTKNGDVLLIYSKSSRIVVYRPSAHKVVDILSVQAASATQK